MTTDVTPSAATPTATPVHDPAGAPAGDPPWPDLCDPRPPRVSRKAVVAVAAFVGSLLVVSAAAVQRFVAARQPASEDAKVQRDRPTAASAEPRRLDLPAASSQPAARGTESSTARSMTPTHVPALQATEDELSDPIGLRHAPAARSAAPGGGSSPEDAPVLLVASRPGPAAVTGSGQPLPAPVGRTEDVADTSSRDPLAATSRNLQNYQQQLQGVLESLTRTASLATTASTAPAWPVASSAVSAAPTGLFGGQLIGSATHRVAAGRLGARSLTLPKGTTFTCALKTRVISATSGLVGCLVQRHVYSEDGRVVLIERGSHVDGEYRIASVRPGQVRIPVLWTRVRTPMGVTVELDSPASGPLGESGIDGHVDNRWTERVGAALLLSLIDDAVKLVIQNQGSDRQGDTIVLPSTTGNASKLAEKVLDSTINIPPLIYRNQGGIVGIHVARDVDFSAVYALHLDDVQEEVR